MNVKVDPKVHEGNTTGSRNKGTWEKNLKTYYGLNWAVGIRILPFPWRWLSFMPTALQEHCKKNTVLKWREIIHKCLIALAVEETALMLLVTRREKNFPAIQKRERALGVSNGESIIHELGTRGWQQWGRVAQEYHEGLQWPVLPLLDRAALVVSRIGSNSQRPAEECWTAVKIWGISVNAPCLQSWVGETRGYKGDIFLFKVHFSEHRGT